MRLYEVSDKNAANQVLYFHLPKVRFRDNKLLSHLSTFPFLFTRFDLARVQVAPVGIVSLLFLHSQT